MYSCIAFTQQTHNGQLCKFCPKDNQQQCIYTCPCGTRFCSAECQKIHFQQGCSEHDKRSTMSELK